jgi:hypothetical protein
MKESIHTLGLPNEPNSLAQLFRRLWGWGYARDERETELVLSFKSKRVSGRTLGNHSETQVRTTFSNHLYNPASPSSITCSYVTVGGDCWILAPQRTFSGFPSSVIEGEGAKEEAGGS